MTVTDTIPDVTRPETVDDFPDLPPGTRIRREDGNIYTIAEDGGWLYDERGNVVSPFTLKPYKNRDLAQVLVLGINFPEEAYL